MKMNLDESIARLKSSGGYYLDDEQLDKMRADFKEALELFLVANYPQGMEQDTLMCSIHDSFPTHHICVACNLQDYTRAVERFLLQFDSFDDINYHYTTYMMQLYLLVERVHTYMELIAVPQAYRARHFQVFQEVKYWANFLKHPKSFMLVLHPTWQYKGMAIPAWRQESEVPKQIVDSSFVREYYSGDKNNKKLYDILARKSDVVVMFPNPVDLTKRFMQALQKFVSVIAENEMVREILESETMVKKHFSTEDNASDQDNEAA